VAGGSGQFRLQDQRGDPPAARRRASSRGRVFFPARASITCPENRQGSSRRRGVAARDHINTPRRRGSRRFAALARSRQHARVMHAVQPLGSARSAPVEVHPLHRRLVGGLSCAVNRVIQAGPTSTSAFFEPKVLVSSWLAPYSSILAYAKRLGLRPEDRAKKAGAKSG